MKKTILAIAAAATIAVGTLSMPDTADARCRFNCGLAIGLGAAVLGGAIIANSQPRYYGPEPGYVVYEGYGARYPDSCPGGYWARKPIAFNAYGEPVRWSRARFICP
jgi:hypothetical protein